MEKSNQQRNQPVPAHALKFSRSILQINFVLSTAKQRPFQVLCVRCSSVIDCCCLCFGTNHFLVRDNEAEEEEVATTPAPAAASSSLISASSTTRPDGTVNDIPAGSMLWIPKQIVKEYNNRDNVPCLAMVIPLTGGTAVVTTTDVEVKLVDNNHTLIIAEKWTYHYSNMNDYYERQPVDPDECQEDRVRKMVNMQDELERIRAESPHGLVSLYKYKLPWKAAEFKKHISGTSDGARTLNIDVYSRARTHQEKIYIADRVGSKSFFKDTTPSKAYSTIE